MNDIRKPYQLTLEVRPDYLYARVDSDTTDQAMVVNYLHEIVSKCKKLHRKHLMLERNIPTTLAEADVYFSETDFAHMGIKNMKIALVDARHENAPDLQLGILVQNKRGADMKLFANTAEAERWLLTPTPPFPQQEESAP